MRGNQEATEPDYAKSTRQDRGTTSGVITAGSVMKDQKEEAMVGMTEDAVGEAKECLTAKSPPWF